MSTPATLPANFDKWDDKKTPPATLPSNFLQWDDPKDAGPVAEQSEQPGIVKRFAQGVGIPTNRAEAIEMFKGTTPSFKEHRVGIPAYTYAKNLYGEGKKAGKEIYEAGENIAAGQPKGANVGKAAAGATDFLLKGVLGPVGGGAIAAWGEDVGTHNYTGAAGDALAVLTNALALKGSRPLPEDKFILPTTTKADAVAKVADLSRGFDDVKTVIPDLSKTSAKPPNTIGELVDNVNKAKDEMNKESGMAMFPIRGRQYVPIPISDRIRNRITPDMMQTADGRRIQTMLTREAAEFQKPWTFEQLDAYRMNHNPEVQAIYKMAPADKASFLRLHPDVAAKIEAVEGIRDIVYPAMDKAAGKPAGYFANLKQRQSTLIKLQKSLDAQVDELTTSQAKIQATSRFSRENLSMYQSHLGPPGVSLHRVQNMLVKEKPLTSANRVVSRAFNGRPTSKAMIYSLPVRELLLPQQNEPPKTPGEARARARQLAPQ